MTIKEILADNRWNSIKDPMVGQVKIPRNEILERLPKSFRLLLEFTESRKLLKNKDTNMCLRKAHVQSKPKTQPDVAINLPEQMPRRANHLLQIVEQALRREVPPTHIREAELHDEASRLVDDLISPFVTKLEASASELLKRKLPAAQVKAQLAEKFRSLAARS